MQLAYQKERAKFAADVSKLEGEITEIESQQLDAYKQIQHAADTGWPEKPAISRIAAEEWSAVCEKSKQERSRSRHRSNQKIPITCTGNPYRFKLRR